MAIDELHHEIRDVVSGIVPLDATESDAQASVLRWIDSGAPLFREHGATPPTHLAVYFAFLDDQRNTVLQVNHVKAGAWLLPGVHLASPVSRMSLSATARRGEAVARVEGFRLGY